MTIPETHPHNPPHTIKKPSNEIHYPQEINPSSEQPLFSDEYTTYHQPDKLNRTETYQYPQHATAPGLHPSSDELNRSFYNPSSESGVGREYSYETQNASDHLTRNVPSTRHMVSNLEKTERVLERRKQDTTNACDDRVIEDLQQVVKDTMNFVEEKNLGDSTRNIIDHGTLATNQVEPSGLNKQHLPSKDVVTQDVADVASQLRRVTQLMVTSPAFRSFMWEFYQLSRDTFGPEMDNVVGQKLGVEEQPYQKYHGTHQSGQSFAPPLPSRHAPALTEQADQKYDRAHQLDQSFAPPLPSRHASSRPEQAEQQCDGAHQFDQFFVPPLPSRHAPARPIDEINNSSAYPHSDNTIDSRAQQMSDPRIGYGATSGPQFNENATRFEPPIGFTGEQHYSNLQRPPSDSYGGHESIQGTDFINTTIPQPGYHINHAKNQVQNTKNRIPSEKRERLVRRWRELFDEINQDSRLQNAVRDMKRCLMYMKDKYKPVVQEHKEKVKDAAITTTENLQEDDHINIALTESKGLLERFAGGKSLNPLINTLDEWYTAIRRDEELRVWFEKFYDYLDTTVRTPEALEDDRHNDELDRFLFRGQYIFHERYSDLSRRLLDETNDFLYSLANDKATSRLRTSVQNLIKDLFIDSEGRFVLKPDLYAKLRKAFMPIISEQLANIEVSHVEEHNDQLDFALANIIIDVNDLKPDQFEVKNIAELAVGRESKDGAEVRMQFRISAKGTTCTVRNVDFSYRKHTFPKLKDSGILDASIMRDGLSFDLDIEFFADATGLGDVGRRDDTVPVRHYRRDRDHAIFKVKSCRVDIDKLKLDFRDANHEILHKVLKPIIVSKATKEISRAIEDQLRYVVKELNKAAIQAREQTMATLEKSGANDHILRGTQPDRLNVGHSHKVGRHENYGESTGKSHTVGQGYDRNGEMYDDSDRLRQQPRVLREFENV